MTERTVLINNVVLTETQLRDGLKQLERVERKPGDVLYNSGFDEQYLVTRDRIGDSYKAVSTRGVFITVDRFQADKGYQRSGTCKSFEVSRG